MNKIIAKKITIGVVTTILLGSLTGCVNKTSSNKAEQQNADQFVNQQMLQVAQSIDSNLKQVVASTRGTEIPRNTRTAIGTTVAGAPSGFLKPGISVNKSEPDGLSNLSRQMISQKLDSEVKITWNSSADGLLRKLASSIGFSYLEQGSTLNPPKVSIKSQRDTVKNILGDVARQLGTQADVKVSVAQKTITLVYH